MGTIKTCDATGSPVGEDAVTIGGLSERIYSPAAAEDVAAYLQERDALHSRLAMEWALKILEYRARFRMKYPAGKLPDEL